MKTVWRHGLVLVAVLLGALNLAAVREATVKRNVNLRRDPSTDNAALELIEANSTVTVLDPAPQNGFYHVKAEDGQEGWVWGKNVSMAAETEGPSTSPSTPASSTKNASATRDPEMKQTRKGKNWHFGMKLHIGWVSPWRSSKWRKRRIVLSSGTTSSPNSTRAKRRIDSLS
jgi:Bacterial SH3 domain